MYNGNSNKMGNPIKEPKMPESMRQVKRSARKLDKPSKLSVKSAKY